ncbi:MAG TPA: HNH endonuclease signature motif containing protein, partial [Jiangellaceae bacterium]
AELPGLGYIPAAVARPLAGRMAAAQWRFVICTPDGIPICSGITTARPTSQRHIGRDPQRGGIVELQLTTTTLFELGTATASGRHADWQPVIGDITDRYRRGILDHKPTTTSPTNHAGDTHSEIDPATADQDARRRRARAGLRRWVEVRARYCQHPTCRMPASQCDQDHRVDYAAGGLTIDHNLDPGCRHDHRLQHDGGWIVYRPPGSDPLTGPIIWLSPLGHTYETRPPPVMHTYPEPGHYYPHHDTLPEWLTHAIKHAKAAQQARVQAGAPDADDVKEQADVDEQPERPRSQYPAEPPF